MKIGFIGSLPAASVMPEEVIRPSHRAGVHPAPWMVALLPELARISGYQMRVFLPQRSVLKHAVVERDGVEYEALPIRFPERWNPQTLFLGTSFAVQGAIRRYRPDLVHAFGIESGCATVALRTGFPVSCFIQGIVEYCYPYVGHSGELRRRLLRWMERSASRRIRWYVAETEFARAWSLQRNPGAHVAVIPHPVRATFTENAGMAGGKRVISVGGLNPIKGMDTIVRAFALVKDPEATLCIVGGGPQRDELHRLMEELGLAGRVELPGALPTGQVLQELKRSGIFVIASRMDTSPNVLSEAHAIGLPAIGTRVGGIPEMINEGEDGFVVDVEDSAEMARRMEQLIAEPDLAARMGAAGSAKVQVLNDSARVAEAHVEFFEHVMRAL